MSSMLFGFKILEKSEVIPKCSTELPKNSLNVVTRFYNQIVSSNCLIKVMHCVKSVHIWSYHGPHFPAFGLNTERTHIE